MISDIAANRIISRALRLTRRKLYVELVINKHAEFVASSDINFGVERNTLAAGYNPARGQAYEFNLLVCKGDKFPSFGRRFRSRSFRG